jgi:hypothetical protein
MFSERGPPRRGTPSAKRCDTLRRSRSSQLIARIEHQADALSATGLRRRFDGKEESMKTTLVSAAALLFIASVAFAQGAPKPAPEMSQVKYFAGSWTCSGDAPASPFGPAHKTKSTMTLKSDLDGFWVDGMISEMKTASNTHPVRGMIHLGYDSAAKQNVMVWLDNFGSWATEMSPGWQGDTMVWTGDQMLMGEKAAAKDTFVKKSDSEFTHKFELQTKGQWGTIVDETCKKAGAAKK